MAKDKEKGPGVCPYRCGLNESCVENVTKIVNTAMDAEREKESKHYSNILDRVEGFIGETSEQVTQLRQHITSYMDEASRKQGDTDTRVGNQEHRLRICEEMYEIVQLLADNWDERLDGMERDARHLKIERKRLRRELRKVNGGKNGNGKKNGGKKNG